MISGFLFLAWRVAEIVTLIPIVGMLAYFGKSVGLLQSRFASRPPAK